jgi:hypothetical protein
VAGVEWTVTGSPPSPKGRGEGWRRGYARRVNLLAHAHVALADAEARAGGTGGPDAIDGSPARGTGGRAAVDHDVVLGAVLPDLATMARARIVDRQRLAPPVGRGVALHLRTDAVFHALPAFVEGAGAIRRAVRERGLSRGAARAVGHVGWELLLDGTLVGTAAEAAFHAALDRAEQAAPAFDAPQRWARLLGYRPQLRQLRYDDPAWVAERLERIFHDRPLLRFEPAQLPLVVEVLADQAPRVAAAADEVLAATAAGLRSAA